MDLTIEGSKSYLNINQGSYPRILHLHKRQVSRNFQVLAMLTEYAKHTYRNAGFIHMDHCDQNLHNYTVHVIHQSGRATSIDLHHLSNAHSRDGKTIRIVVSLSNPCLLHHPKHYSVQTDIVTQNYATLLISRQFIQKLLYLSCS